MDKDCYECRIANRIIEGLQERLLAIQTICNFVCGGKVSINIAPSVSYAWDTANFTQGQEPAHYIFKDGQMIVEKLDKENA